MPSHPLGTGISTQRFNSRVGSGTLPFGNRDFTVFPTDTTQYPVLLRIAPGSASETGASGFSLTECRMCEEKPEEVPMEAYQRSEPHVAAATANTQRVKLNRFV